MPNRRFNKQVANPMKAGGRVKRMGGGMSTRRKDMKSGYYPDDMGMKGGPMMRKSLGIKKGEKIPASKLKAAAKKKGKLGQRARLAITLSKLRKKK
jgi:hypothetical protein